MFKKLLAISYQRRINLIRAALGSEHRYVKASQRPVLFDQIAAFEEAIDILRGA